MHSIKSCAQKCLEKSTFIQIQLYTYESRLTWHCKQSVRELPERNQVTLMWVSGYKGLKGNTKPDTLEKEGADAPSLCPELFKTFKKSYERGIATMGTEFLILFLRRLII